MEAVIGIGGLVVGIDAFLAVIIIADLVAVEQFLGQNLIHEILTRHGRPDSAGARGQRRSIDDLGGACGGIVAGQDCRIEHLRGELDAVGGVVFKAGGLYQRSDMVGSAVKLNGGYRQMIAVLCGCQASCHVFLAVVAGNTATPDGQSRWPGRRRPAGRRHGSSQDSVRCGCFMDNQVIDGQCCQLLCRPLIVQFNLNGPGNPVVCHIDRAGTFGYGVIARLHAGFVGRHGAGCSACAGPGYGSLIFIGGGADDNSACGCWCFGHDDQAAMPVEVTDIVAVVFRNCRPGGCGAGRAPWRIPPRVNLPFGRLEGQA